MPLKAYACDDLLILDWLNPEGIKPGMSIHLNGSELEKPILGAEWVEMPRFLLVAWSKGISRCQQPVIHILDRTGQKLAEYTATTLPLWSLEQTADLSLPTRMRLEKVLLSRAAESFPRLKPASLNRLANSLVDPSLSVRRSPEGALYVRLPWATAHDPGLLSVNLRKTSSRTNEEQILTVKALAEGGYLHCLILNPERVIPTRSCSLIEAEPVRRTALSLKKLPELPSTQSLIEWLEQDLLKDYPGDRAALKAYVLVQHRANLPARPRLMGRINGIRSGLLDGMAWDTQQPDQVLSLEVCMDGHVLAVVDAQHPNPKHSPTDQAPVNCRFLYALDTAMLGDEPHTIEVREQTTGALLTGSPLYWGAGHFDGQFSITPKGTLSGWVEERCHAPCALMVRVLIDGKAQVERHTHPEVSAAAYRFEWQLPEWVFDTELHRITLEVRRADCHEWVHLSHGVGVKTTYQGQIESVDANRVGGWIINRTAPERPVMLDLLVNGRVVVADQRADIFRSDAQEKPGRYGFEFSLPADDLSANTRLVSVHLAGTAVAVLGPPIQMTPYDVAIQALGQAAARLNHWEPGDSPADPEITLWVRTQVLGQIQAGLRKAKTLPTRITLDLSPLTRMPAYSEADPVLDVIVPVYGSRVETLNCLHSVLNARTDTYYELIVIDDASPDDELREALRLLARQNRLTLLENAHNQGFVASVNRGMQQHPGRDVVLLNSDTQVADGWLDRLQQAAGQDRCIGTVTPLSNNATICTVPVPPPLDVAAMDALCARVNAGITVDIPTAVGFCMYIKRRVLDETGYFNQALWGKGYAEENDFCLKSATLGWRHLAATDVFVWHEGGCSFGDSKMQRINTHLDKLNRMYPEYAPRIQRFEAQDPLALPRNRIIREWLKQQSNRYILFVIHGLGGGTHVAADTLARRLELEGYPVLQLMSRSPERWEIKTSGWPHPMTYTTADRYPLLLEDLRELGVWHIHYHQTMQFPLEIWDIPQALGLAYDVSLHDYLPICPRINMIDATGSYCEESQFQPEICHRCLSLNGFDEDATNHLVLRNKFEGYGQDIRIWRNHYARFLTAARRVIAPSQSAADIFLAHFPIPGLQVIAHPEYQDSPPPLSHTWLPYRVVVLGAIGQHKGYDLLLHCIRLAYQHGLPLHFTVIGYTRDDEALLQFSNVSITGSYEAGQLAERIADSQAGVALFLSPWPETYCFTLSEAWLNGLYPVALDIGAVAERIRASGQGVLLPVHASAKTINLALMDVFTSEHPTVEYECKPLTSVAREYYGWDDSPTESPR